MPNVVVPQLGESVVEARVARWLKKVGDHVDAGEPVVELETDKIDLEVGSEQSGVITRIEREEGADVKVGEVLAVVESTGAAAQPEPAGPKPDAKPAVPESAQGPEPAPSAATQGLSPAAPAAAQPEPEPRATATARRMADEHGIDLSRVTGTGEGGRITKEDVQKFIASAPPTEPAFDTARATAAAAAAP
ncbi:MAG TPA: biotin/lipoyl-containing protein, partial [Vicinamibacterales bacterium]|nr:biotin/lipoyl-containing protein [Vicinamibacterales bacterium]